MIKYFYIKTKREAVLITADKAKHALYQANKVFDIKENDIVKFVEITKEKYDRILLWRDLAKQAAEKKRKKRKKGIPSCIKPLLAADAFINDIGSNYYDYYGGKESAKIIKDIYDI